MKKFSFLLAFIFVFLSFEAYSKSSPTTFYVYNTSNKTNTQNSLPWAVDNADDDDVIEIRTTGTVVLKKHLVIKKDITINGPGANIFFIDGDDKYHIYIKSKAKVEISGVTIQNGFADFDEDVDSEKGGGIYNEGKLKLKECTVKNCRATYGGGIYTSEGSKLTLRRCTIEGNDGISMGLGGGLYVAGYAEIHNSTIFSNTDPIGGGGICLRYDIGGAGVSPTNGYDFGLYIYNSTITDNFAGNEIYHTGNGGGIYIYEDNPCDPLVFIINSIVARNNCGATGDDIHLRASSSACTPDVRIETGGYNIIGNNETVESFFPSGNPNVNNDYVGNSGNPANPDLEDDLYWNGGFTRTLAINSSSSLPVNKIPSENDYNYSANQDQRGIMRYENGDNYDIGAFEFNDDGDNSLKENEDAGPNNGDGNYDGIPDDEQENVATYRSGLGYVTVVGLNGVKLHNVTPFTDFPQGQHNLPYNMSFFQVIGESSAAIRLIYHGLHIPNDMELIKYNYLVNPPQWITDIPYTKTYDESHGLTIIEYTIYDNDVGDIDNTEGVITDPAGGTITYMIPVFEAWHIIVLSFLLIILGIFFIRRIIA